MESITKYSDYELNESTIEIEDSEEGVYVLTLHDISNIINAFTDTTINDDAIIEELQDYKFVKVDDAEITQVDDELFTEEPPIDEIDELSSDDENPTFIKKFEQQ